MARVAKYEVVLEIRPLVLRVIPSSPKQLYSVGRELVVAGDHGEILGQCLGDHKAVKRIVMMKRKAAMHVQMRD